MTTRKPVTSAQQNNSFSEVFDLDAAVAQRREASKANSFDFDFSGKRYSMPLDLKLSAVRKLNKLPANDVEGTLGVILGDQAEALFEADPTLTALTSLMEAYQKAVGVSVGKDSGSND